MRARGLVVERSRGEEARRALREARTLREDLAIVRRATDLVLPLVDGAEPPSTLGRLEEHDFPVQERPSRTEFRDLLDWPAERKRLLPRSFDIVGDIVLIRLPSELEGAQGEIGEALLRFVPGARLVGLDRGVEGVERRRRVERIAGAGPWTTRHRENGLAFDVDVERAYFSPRLAGEHARLASLSRPGERVYDLCCGVGPFSVMLAQAGRIAAVTAVDANPVAIRLLRGTLARYPFGPRVEPVEASVEAFAASAPPVERVIMNLPREGIKYGPQVAPLVAPGGSLHYYEVVRRDEVRERGNVVERALSSVGPFAVRELRVVHPYSPSSDLIAVTAMRAGA